MKKLIILKLALSDAELFRMNFFGSTAGSMSSDFTNPAAN